jgi:hypothetical protein
MMGEGPTGGMNILEKRKSLTPTGIKTEFLCCPAHNLVDLGIIVMTLAFISPFELHED